MISPAGLAPHAAILYPCYGCGQGKLFLVATAVGQFCPPCWEAKGKPAQLPHSEFRGDQ